MNDEPKPSTREAEAPVSEAVDVWVLTASQGEYSDRSEWTVSVHSNEAEARAEVERLDGEDRLTRKRGYDETTHYLSGPFKLTAPSPASAWNPGREAIEREIKLWADTRWPKSHGVGSKGWVSGLTNRILASLQLQKERAMNRVHSGPEGASIPTEQSAESEASGQVSWFSSGVDEGPDCGLSVSLGNSLALFVGELADRTVREGGVDPDTFPGIGWWVALEDGTSLRVIGAVADQCAGQALVESIAAAINRRVS